MSYYTDFDLFRIDSDGSSHGVVGFREFSLHEHRRAECTLGRAFGWTLNPEAEALSEREPV
ncbi:MAG: hypothetical protein ACXWXA_04695 [Candidatus Limnocylindrales bacterium]